MTRYIDADALKRKAQKVATEAWKMRLKSSVETILNQFIDWIEGMPTIDAVEVVRCGDCRLHGTYRCPMWDEDVWGGGNTKDYMWCYFGERKSGDTE